MFDHKNISAFFNKISFSDRIVIIPHKDPDGDAIGSSLAWNDVLTKQGYSVSVVSPNEITQTLSWMKGFDDIVIYKTQIEKAKEVLKDANFFIFLDFNNLTRIGALHDELIKLNAPRLVVDHHPFPQENIADVLVSDTTVSSTCELSFTVLKALDWSISLDAAECLYTGIMTDTGLLNHNSSRPEIYHIVAELIGKGVDKEKIHNKIFQSNSLSRTRLFGHALCNKLEILPSQKVGIITLTQSELKEFDYKLGDTEGLVNEPLSIKGVEVAALFTEKEDNIVRTSFRSIGDIAVNKYSEQYFNGGGHKNAAGGKFKGSLSAAVEAFKNTVESYFYKE